MVNLFQVPYFFKKEKIDISNESFLTTFLNSSLKEKKTETEMEATNKEKNYSVITTLIDLYTPKGFAEKYKKTGRFIFLYPVDDPLTPPPLVITNVDYHYYQSFM